MVAFAPHPDRRPVAVTGASSGIGEATARALAAAGHPVVLGARRAERCEAIAAEIRANGGDAAALHLDVSDPGSVKEFAVGAVQAFDGVEALVSNAGDTTIGTTAGTPPDDFAAQVQVNLLGAQHLVAELVPAMVQRRRGDVVFVTSDIVRVPRPGIAGYAAAKFGLEGMARVLQMELEGTGVRASIVRPGPTITGMGSNWDPDAFGELIEEWVRWGAARHHGYLDPANVAAAVVTVISTPRGAHLTLVEVEPEAPVRHTE